MQDSAISFVSLMLVLGTVAPLAAGLLVEAGHRSARQWRLLAVIAPFALAALVVSILLIAQLGRLALLPDNIWFGLPILAWIWWTVRSRPGGLAKSIADSLQPWLIALSVLVGFYLVAQHFIPRAQWIWLFRIEEAIAFISRTLSAILPRTLAAKLGVILVTLSLNLVLPRSRFWTDGFATGLKRAGEISGVLVILAGVTVFGGSRFIALGATVTAEKYQRVEKDAIGLAQLAIAARIKANPQVEAKAAQAWVDAVATGVAADAAANNSAMGGYVSKTQFEASVASLAARQRGVITPEMAAKIEAGKQEDRARIRRLVEARVAELRHSVMQLPLASRAADPEGAGLRRSNWSMSDGERDAAKQSFAKAVDTLIKEGVKLTSEPLMQLLGSAEAPGLIEDLVKDYYKQETVRLSKYVAEPLADALFRPGTRAAAAAPARIAELTRQAPASVEALPREVRAPTAKERRAVHEALERAREAERRARI